MAQSIKGKLVTIKDAPDHWWGGHWGYVVDENLIDDEYFVAGGSITPKDYKNSSLPVPCLCRDDITVLRDQSIQAAMGKTGRVAL